MDCVPCDALPPVVLAGCWEEKPDWTRVIAPAQWKAVYQEVGASGRQRALGEAPPVWGLQALTAETRGRPPHLSVRPLSAPTGNRERIKLLIECIDCFD